MKVLLVGEGVHEHVAAEVLIRRILELEVEIECRKWIDREFRKTRMHGKGHGFVKVVVAFLREAARRRFDAVVFLTDVDREAGRIEAMDAAQSEVHESLPHACGVAVQSFDAWILADERTLGSVLESEVDACQDPEKIKDPKAVCEKLRDDSGCGRRLREIYAEYAANADLDLIKRRCPRGFAPFADRVERLRPTGSA